MVSRGPYPDFNTALKSFRVQVSESIPYALDEFPRLDSPEAIFNYLKPRLTYKKDPKGVELFQTLPTLLDNNRHGITGAGDCDCFSIAALSTLLANGFTDSGIVLAGRSPLNAVHIWVYTDVNGKRYDLDLTNKMFDQTRFYPFIQHIPYKLNQNEKDMILELAEGGTRRRRGKYHVGGYFRRYPMHEGGLSETVSTPRYVYLPRKGVNVREDYYDGMNAGEFQQMCLSEGVPLQEIEQLSKGRAQRRAERKAAKPRNVRKAQKRASKDARKMVTAQSKANARIARSNNPNRGGLIKSIFTPDDTDPNGSDPNTFDPYSPPSPEQYAQQLVPQDQDAEYYEAEEVENDEPTYQMSEGFAITRKQAIVGGLLLLGLGVGTAVVLKRRRRRKAA